MPSFIAVAQLFRSQPMNFSAHPHNCNVKHTEPKNLIHFMDITTELRVHLNGIHV